MARPRLLTILAIIVAITASGTLLAQSILCVDDSPRAANDGLSLCDAFASVLNADTATALNLGAAK
jgi:hypothetical protein